VPLDGLDQLAARGQQLLRLEDDAVRTHSAFERWADEVSGWLSARYPNSGLSAEWGSIPTSGLVLGGQYYDDPLTWMQFRLSVQRRLQWLGHLPTKLSVRGLDLPARAQNDSETAGRKEIKLNAVARAYVDPDRINELKALSPPIYDLARLVRLCEELNVCFAAECYLAMIVLTRAIIDHVPPIFGQRTFADVANNWAGGKSLKESFLHLDGSSRKIADHYLHAQVRKSEPLPNAVQVNFSNALDLLLAEVVAKLK
jgi:hypothetical protein